MALMTVLLALPATVAVVAPAAAVPTATVGLYADAGGPPAVHSAVPGEWLVASGRLPAGTTSAELQRLRPSGAWIRTGLPVGTATTYQTQVRAPDPLGHYQFRMQAKGSYGTVVSAIWKLDVIVQKNTFGFTSPRTTRIVEGAGSVNPPRPGRWVYVQAMVGGAWQYVATVRQDTRGAYRFRVLPSGTGPVTYRTVPASGGNGSPPRAVQVRPWWPLDTKVDLAPLDTVHGSEAVVGPSSVQLGSDNSHTSARWALPPGGGTRVFGTTLRVIGPNPAMALQVVVRTDRRTLLVTTLTPGHEVPVSLDITGASSLTVSENPNPWTEWTYTHAQLLRPEFIGKPGPVVTLPRQQEYLAELTPVAKDACLEFGTADSGSLYPASIVWYVSDHLCHGAASVEYALGGSYARLTASLGQPWTSAGTDLNGGALTVVGDGRVLGTYAVPDGETAIDLDVNGVQQLRLVFGFNPSGSGLSGTAALLSPTLFRRS